MILRMFALTCCAVALADDSVLSSKHDLSVTGPGPVRATGESEVCIFCHTPHNASPAAPLWNRTNPQTHYRTYSSSTTDARVGQPTGASKLCLSCHDGSIALGMVLSRDTPIPMSHTFIPTGRSDLTNDLSDDHPIGLRYDRQLTNRDRQLRDPELVDHRVSLGERGELECTACHNPHNNELGDFLRITTREGALCITCHSLDGWRTSSHALRGKPVPDTFGGEEPLPYHSMAENACASCHVSHGAPQRERLLRARSYDLCIECHNGLTASDVSGRTGQRSGHRPRRLFDRHDPAEDPRTMRPHVDCVDCHNPHAARPNELGGIVGTGLPGGLGAARFGLPGPLTDTAGVSISGQPLERAREYYEVCFRCHSDNPVPMERRIVRARDDYGNVRRQFLPSAASAHPIATLARTPADESPSLRPELRARTSMSCQDCHNDPDARQLGGSSPNGPHGSRFDWLLAARYETADFTIESPQSYALCYTCHDRTSLLNDESFTLHRRHVVDAQTPCSACHSPHGVSGSRTEHDHLINFDTAIVNGRRQFVDTGRLSGSCTLTCHGVEHVNLTYQRN